MSKLLFIETLGCAMNSRDTEHMIAELTEKEGFEMTNDFKVADLILINTCSVRERPVHKLFSELGGFNKHKKPHAKIGVCGCTASHLGKEIIKRAPYVNFVLGARNVSKISEIIHKDKAVEIDINYDDSEFAFKDFRSSPFKGFINISTGYDEDSNLCFVRIKDSGVGIDETYLPHVFDAFRQESLGYSRNYQGAGLGLPIAKRLINLMNGDIKIESSKGEGTVVTVFLKSITEKKYITPKKILIKDKDTLNKELKKHNLKIFIVEDDRMNRMVLEKMLQNTAEVISSVDGDDAMNIINKYSKKGEYFDVMLIDINLPSPWDGIMVMKKIKEKWEKYNDVPFIAQTAYAMSGDKERFIEAGFDDYISKPITQSKLFNIINNNLNR